MVGNPRHGSAAPKPAPVEINVLEPSTAEPMPARLHLRNGAGQPVKPPQLPNWRDHFVSDSPVRLELPPGEYSYEVERGPEYEAGRGTFSVGPEGSTQVRVPLARLANLAGEGWWSGETHVHRRLEEVELLMRAEDLHVAQITTWWNKANPWAGQPLPPRRPVPFDRSRFYHPLAGEDERDGGALLYFNLDRPLDITGGTKHYPSSLVFAEQARQRPGAWIEIEKPFWWDLPMWLAHGIGDSVGVAHNHLQREGVLGNEAWGRPRDPRRFPGLHGNGLWTQDIYFHLLNCGFRLPPSAGSASGVLPNPVGYNRVWVQVDGELTWEKWWEGLRAGRCFVGNGPLLRARANGRWPGHIFKGHGPLEVRLQAQLDSRDPIKTVELIRNGRAEPVSLPAVITIQESGWFLLRATAEVTNTLRFALTAPWHVEIGEQPRPVRRESAQFFQEWTHERIAILETNSNLTPRQRDDVLAPWRRTAAFWQEKVAQSVQAVPVTGEVVNEANGERVASRIYIQRADGRWFFPESASARGSALRYERRNWINTNAVEFHTTLSAHPFRLELEPGRYTVTVERGKEYRPLVRILEVGTEPVALKLPLHRWVDLAARGWFSGDTHVHRTPTELSNVMQAEDLNVAFPLAYWVTKAQTPPTQGDKSSVQAVPENLIRLDDTHVVWPRNTEWEIFSVGGRSHTLGAVFALGHKQAFTLGVPPVGPVAEQARRDGALLDLDKHDWPWSMALVPLMGVDLFELANNHHWRTQFGITQWNQQPPVWMGLTTRRAAGGERDWTLYGFQTYYTLLNCGFPLRPTAGTANGVHPVPLGFSRVYVHLPGGFSYEGWRTGLDQGHSFVTTGPMLLATANGRDPGEKFQSASVPANYRLRGTVLSEEPLTFLEVIHNGQPVQTLMPQNRRTPEGGYETSINLDLSVKGSGWFVLRCWEDRPGDRFRFAHTAPWHVEVPGHPLRPRPEEKDFLVGRVRDEMERSRTILPPAAITEYERALASYERVTARDDTAEARAEARQPKDEQELRFWLENMLVFHRFTPAEVSAATGLNLEEVATLTKRFDLANRPLPLRRPGAPLRVLPYPAGRHPRLGFLEGALAPQRETKVSVFTPWDPTAYVVADVPEAIWSNLGLTYLAHTHIPTIWTQRGLPLAPLEWNRRGDGTLDFERTLPTGIRFGTKVAPTADSVRFESWLGNGTAQALTGLRVQNCVLLRGAPDFAAQTGGNKLLQAPYAACRSADGRRWVITAWDPLDRVWQNPPVPCLHSDPKYPDCAPGQTVRLRGWLSFYEGTNITAELARIEATGWRR